MPAPRPAAPARRPAPAPAAPPPAPRAAGFAPAAAAIVLAWALAFAPQLFAGRVFTAGDSAANQTFAEFSAARWRATHQRTLWNPYVFLGLPAAASLADSRPQYLPGPLLDALGGFDRLPVWPPLVLPLLAHLAGMLAAAALARALWRTGPWPAAWAGLAWGLLPNQIVPVAYGHQAQLVTVALMPVSLLLVHALFAARAARAAGAAALALALATALAILAGHPQYAYDSL